MVEQNKSLIVKSESFCFKKVFIFFKIKGQAVCRMQMAGRR